MWTTGQTDWQRIGGTLSSGTTSYTHTGLTAGNTYYYRVRAVINSAEGLWSEKVSGRCLKHRPPSSRPAPPRKEALRVPPRIKKRKFSASLRALRGQKEVLSVPSRPFADQKKESSPRPSAPSADQKKEVLRRPSASSCGQKKGVLSVPSRPFADQKKEVLRVPPHPPRIRKRKFSASLRVLRGQKRCFLASLSAAFADQKKEVLRVPPRLLRGQKKGVLRVPPRPPRTKKGVLRVPPRPSADQKRKFSASLRALRGKKAVPPRYYREIAMLDAADSPLTEDVDTVTPACPFPWPHQPATIENSLTEPFIHRR